MARNRTGTEQQELDDRLFTAIWEEGTDDVARLLEEGASLDAQDEYGDTPLHDAASGGKEDVVKLLLAAGADPSAKNNKDELLSMLLIMMTSKHLLKKK